MEYPRKQKEDRPVLAICYDFDKTLSPDDMQAQGYIQSVGYDVERFWAESRKMAVENDMDSNLAYMLKMVQEARGRMLFTKEKLREYGSGVKLYPGVDGWFDRIKAYGDEYRVKVEHYIISSGLKEMIEGTSPARRGAFEKVYASSFFYDGGGVAIWPAQAINYTNKTQFLFRIEKGVLDINDPGVNDYFPPEQRRVPFRNMVYIGDSETDVPCMKLVNAYGGHAIGVYDPDTQDRQKVFQMMTDDRIRYFAPADYSADAPLDRLLKAILRKTAAYEVLEDKHQCDRMETDSFTKIPDAIAMLASENNIRQFTESCAGSAQIALSPSVGEALQKLRQSLEAAYPPDGPKQSGREMETGKTEAQE